VLAAEATTAHKYDRASLMLAALVSVFILSHAFRTVVTIAANPLAAELGASAQWLARFTSPSHSRNR
jgi:hypothetical protein